LLTWLPIPAFSWELSWCDHHSPFVIFLRARSNERSAYVLRRSNRRRKTGYGLT
jgi:hypothetical protein